MPFLSTRARQAACAFVAFAGLLGAPALRAQKISSTPLTVTSSTLRDGDIVATSADTAAFEFTFSRDLPFSNRYDFGFHFEPRQRTLRVRSFFGGGKTVRYTIRHQMVGDYVAYAFGVLTCDNNRGTGCFNPPTNTFYLQTRPYVVNYTTAATHGTRRVTGTTTFGDVAAPPAKNSYAALLRDIVEEAFSAETHDAAPPPFFASAATDSLQRTVVFLLDAYTLNAARWLPRAGAAPDAAGSWAMDYVRDGLYWPVAVHFADRFGQTIARFGYHDADGDFEPDPVTVAGGDVSGLKIVLMPDEPVRALGPVATARRRAQRLFADAELHTVTALGPTPDGTAALWRYAFYSPAQDSLVTVDAGSFSTSVFVEKAAQMRGRLDVPTPFVDSDVILQKAEADGGAAFRDQYPEQTVGLMVELGDLPLPVRPPAPARFWHVVYESPFEASPQRRVELFYDAETGARLEGQPVAAEGAAPVGALRLDGPVPSPARGPSRVTFTLAAGGPVRLAAYDLMGRRVALLVEGPQPAGTQTVAWDTGALAPGLYVLRLESGAAHAQRPVVVVR